MTVPRESRFGYKDHNVVTMKNVEGQLLRREQSHTGAAAPFEGDYNSDRDADDHNGVELTYSLKKSDSFRRSKIMAQEPPLDVNYYAPSVNSSPALRRNVRAWCDATGLPTSVTILCNDRVFHLHKVRDESLISNRIFNNFV